MAGITVEKYDWITHPQQYAEQEDMEDVSPAIRGAGGMGDVSPSRGLWVNGIPQIKTFYYNIIVYIQFYYG